jgi:hypothetical protein
MKYIYQEYASEFGSKFVKRTDINGIESHIPSDEGNSDYQRYLRWLENPNEEDNGGLN